MASKRMFSLNIVDTDRFWNLPPMCKLLYYSLSMYTDDDGFVDSVNKILKLSDCSDDDLTMLIDNGYLILFDSGICVIRHFLINNNLRNDRYKETLYKLEKSTLMLDDNSIYNLKTDNQMATNGIPSDNHLATNGIPSDNQMATNGSHSITKHSITKHSITKHSIDRDGGGDPQPHTPKNFIKPTVEEITIYCHELKKDIEAQRFMDHYESNGWMIGKNKMKDWKATVRNWIRRDEKENASMKSTENKTDWSKVLT